MARIYRLLSAYADALMALGCIALTLMMVHVTADVAGKYLLNQPVLGTLESVTHYYMVAAVFLPLAVVQRHRGQVIVDIATQHLAPRRLALVEGLVSIMTLSFTLFLLWHSGKRAVDMSLIFEKSNAVHFPIDVWPSRWFVPLGAAGMAAFIAMQAINDFAFAFRGERLFEEAAPGGLH